MVREKYQWRVNISFKEIIREVSLTELVWEDTMWALILMITLLLILITKIRSSHSKLIKLWEIFRTSNSHLELLISLKTIRKRVMSLWYLMMTTGTRLRGVELIQGIEVILIRNRKVMQVKILKRAVKDDLIIKIFNKLIYIYISFITIITVT